MNFKNIQGGVLIFVMVLSFIIILFIALLLTLYGDSVSHVKVVRDALYNDYKSSNMAIYTKAAYLDDSELQDAYAKKSGVDHYLTRYFNNYTKTLHAGINTLDKYYIEFNKSFREATFTNPETGALHLNNLDDIKNFKVYWNMKSDWTEASPTDDLVDFKKYNPQKRTESSDIRITLVKYGNSTYAVKCFLSSNSDIVSTAASGQYDSVFNNSITIDESYFKRSIDCTTTLDAVPGGSPPYDQDDPYKNELMLNANGVAVLDFNNYSYLLLVEPVSGVTTVRTVAIGNNGGDASIDGYTPTPYLNINIYPETSAKFFESNEFIGSYGSVAATSFGSVTYQSNTINSDSQVTNEEVLDLLYDHFVNTCAGNC